MKSRKILEEIAGDTSENEVMISFAEKTYDIKSLEYTVINGKKVLVLHAGKLIE